jgi:5-formyltetrahydrofolate cyclo-ligase
VDDPDTRSAKAELREAITAGRRALTRDELTTARAAIRRHVLERVTADCVAAYVPLRTEPGSTELLATLHARGVRVLVPITLDDRDLDWCEWDPGATGPALGRQAVTAAGLALVPALAVDRRGTRLGRGGGSYDRALRRLAGEAFTVALLFDGEVVPDVPADPWDVPVAAAVTPSGWVELGGNPEFPSGR